jgi:hypothetical protein
MKLSAITFSAIAACALSACTSVTVTTDYDHSASFAKYKTYALAPAAKRQTLSPTAEAALSGTLRTELTGRGISEASGGKADLAVVPQVFANQKTSVQQYTDWGYGYRGTWPYGYGRYGVWNGAPRTYVDVNQYLEGTLILDFVDTHTNKLVFRGTGKAVVGDAESNAAKISEAVKQMVAALPVGASH